MSVSHQNSQDAEEKMVRLVETVRLLCTVVQELTVSNGQLRQDATQRAVTAAAEAKAAAEDTLTYQYRQIIMMESRMAEWEIPPVCNCGRIGYEVWCRCGKQLK